MRFKYIFGLILLVSLLACKQRSGNKWVQLPPEQWPEITLTNEIVFENQTFTDFAAGFLVETGKDTFAITSKQVFVAFSGLGISTIDFKGKLKSWSMYPKSNPDSKIVLGELLNPDSTQLSVFPNYTNASDWLIFRIKENNSSLTPIKAKQASVSPKQRVFVVYRPDGQSPGSAPEILSGSVVQSLDNQIFINLDHEPDNPLFATGAPIITSEGILVGLLTSINTEIGQSCAVTYLYKVLAAFEKK